MRAEVTTLDATAAGSVELNDTIFNLEPRPDLIHRMVRWQQLKRMAGTHHAQDRSEVTVTGKKFVKQKGSGGARHGDKSAPQFRGGGKAFGPRFRSHETALNKKIRALGLRHAISSKAKDAALVILDKTDCDGKTKNLVKGAVPGVKGAWVSVRDAVKRKLPDGAPKPGAFKLPEAAAPAAE